MIEMILEMGASTVLMVLLWFVARCLWGIAQDVWDERELALRQWEAAFGREHPSRKRFGRRTLHGDLEKTR